jgi:hypothetical protein
MLELILSGACIFVYFSCHDEKPFCQQIRSLCAYWSSMPPTAYQLFLLSQCHNIQAEIKTIFVVVEIRANS